MSKPASDYFTVVEAAAWLGMPVAIVRRWCHNGKLPALRSGKTWLIRQEDLRRVTVKRDELEGEEHQGQAG